MLPVSSILVQRIQKFKNSTNLETVHMPPLVKIYKLYPTFMLNNTALGSAYEENGVHSHTALSLT